MRNEASSLAAESCGHSSRPGRSQHPTVFVHWSLRSMPDDRQLSKSQMNPSVQADEAAAAPDCCRGTWSPANWMPEADEQCVRSESLRPRRTLAASGAMPLRAECRLGRAAALALALTGAASEKVKCMYGSFMNTLRGMDFGDEDFIMADAIALKTKEHVLHDDEDVYKSILNDSFPVPSDLTIRVHGSQRSWKVHCAVVGRCDLFA